MNDTSHEERPDESPSQLAMEQHIDRLCIQLMEHFDSVRIFATRTVADSGQTQGFSRGNGNYYAQRGVVEDWLVSQRQITKNEVSGNE
jgi:hypothetical protein